MYKEGLKFKDHLLFNLPHFSSTLLLYKESFPLPDHIDGCEWIALGAQGTLGRRKKSNTIFFFLKLSKSFHHASYFWW